MRFVVVYLCRPYDHLRLVIVGNANTERDIDDNDAKSEILGSEIDREADKIVFS